jgi:AcrR family transcriptional regulator
MDNLIEHIRFTINPAIFIKDPVSSELGRKIVQGSVELLDEIGLEDFSFRKLAERIESTEASVYRYFENKHQLLLYLCAWYWQWMEYRIAFQTTNLPNTTDRLRVALRIVTAEVTEDRMIQHIHEGKLHRVIVAESAKVYLHKSVDSANAYGAYLGYKNLVQRLSDFVTEINPEFEYPHMLISTVIEGAHHQRFFAEHLPRLTDVVDGADAVTDFYINLVFNAIA